MQEKNKREKSVEKMENTWRWRTHEDKEHMKMENTWRWRTHEDEEHMTIYEIKQRIEDIKKAEQMKWNKNGEKVIDGK